MASEYAHLAERLTAGWLTRREVFEHAATPASGQNEVASAGRPANPKRLSLTIVWGILVGALALIPILCACLAALLLAPGISQTRQMIANSMQPASVLTQTTIADVNAIATPAAPLAPAPGISLSQTASPQETAVPVTPDGAAKSPSRTASPISPLVSPLQATSTSAARLTVEAATPLPSRTPQPTSGFVSPATATMPPTFTPLPTNPAMNSPLATPTLVPATATVTSQPGITSSATVTANLTPTPTTGASVLISSSVVISTVMYNGTPAYNESDQYVEIQNRGGDPVSIGNWTITAQSSGRKFYFTPGLVLMPGEACRVYGSSPPSSASGCGSFSFSSPTPVWSDISDVAELYNDQNVLVGVYKYQAQP
ncbi:MAG: lamin tail domain-containing protein [Chloroflexi bacterium]|nr:lamin tail domain-containing protein [Chloroflexota bacterium]MCL5275850.1 lamin tail domain-containing protein [Chloroflexota bacterium]